MSWVTVREDGHALQASAWQDGAWQPAVTAAEGQDWFVNWADVPTVIGGSPWAASWLVRSGDAPYAYDVFTAVSKDQGATWTAPRKLHDDGTTTEHGFVSLFPQPGSEGLVGAIWLDGRETVDDGAMTLRSAILDGAGRISDPRVVDGDVCDCCQTDVARADVGPIAVYRNRTGDETRDIYVTRLVNDEWEPGRPVAEDGWTINGCPVNGPAVAASGTRAAVAWYTGAGRQPAIRLSFSSDSGETFSEPVTVAQGAIMGRVDVALLDNGAAVSWVENVRRGDDVIAGIHLRIIEEDGAMGPPIPVAETGGGRPSGFPQMVRVDDRLLLAWTDTLGATPTVAAAWIAIP
jgi:hypothetical protein